MTNNTRDTFCSKGHPCHGCPYTFAISQPSCTLGASPGNCFWYFYKRMTGRPAAPGEKKKPPCAAEHIEKGIEMLLQVAERKFGKAYADQLRNGRTIRT
jgi:hypothetical protein